MSLTYKLGLILGRSHRLLARKLFSSKAQKHLAVLDPIKSQILKGANVDAASLQEKAKKIMVERKWDILLIEAYLTTKHFVAWSQREDFEECWNVGIRSLKGVRRNIDVSYIRQETEFVSGEFNEINFQLGGVNDYSSMPDGDSFNTTNIALFIDSKRVLAVRYVMKNYEAYSPQDYSLLSVEEFHNHPSIEPLLGGIHFEKLQQEIKRKEREKIEEEKKYAGKFTF